jgi:hypothetical protein
MIVKKYRAESPIPYKLRIQVETAREHEFLTALLSSGDNVGLLVNANSKTHFTEVEIQEMLAILYNGLNK